MASSVCGVAMPHNPVCGNLPAEIDLFFAVGTQLSGPRLKAPFRKGGLFSLVGSSSSSSSSSLVR